MNRNLKNSLIFLACLLYIFAMLFGIIYLSENYKEVYGMAELEDGVLDLSQYTLIDHIGTNLMGEWEFYYNKWIITDNLDVPSDAIINVGDSWKGMIIDGEEIPATGYASYKLTIQNADVGEFLYFGSTNYYVPHSIYINGELVYSVGEMQKEYSVNWISYQINDYSYEVKTAEDLEVVIEISGTNRGGLYMPLWLHGTTVNYTSFLGLYDLIMYVVVGVILAFVVFNFLMTIGVDKMYNKSYFAWFMLFFFLRYMTGLDGQVILIRHNLAPSYYLFKMFGSLFAVLMVATFVKMIVQYGYITWSNKESIAIFSIVAVSAIASDFLSGYSNSWIIMVCGYFSLFYIVWKLIWSKHESRRYVLVHMGCFLLIIAMLIMEYMNLNGALNFGLDSISSYVACVIVTVCGIDNLVSLKKMQADWVSCKEQFLRAQMTPHYMFNVLSAIIAEYRKDIDTADEHMVEFCDNLRNCIELKDDVMVDFLDDIQVLQEQIKLINLAKDGRVNVTYNLHETNFRLPAFALQPLVENAIMHRGGEIKEKIEIIISTFRVENTYQISVQDNGNGFEEKDIPPDATGIKNCKTRLEILANAKLNIKSTKGVGTKATIILPIPEEKTTKSKKKQ